MPLACPSSSSRSGCGERDVGVRALTGRVERDVRRRADRLPVARGLHRPAVGGARNSSCSGTCVPTLLNIVVSMFTCAPTGASCARLPPTETLRRRDGGRGRDAGGRVGHAASDHAARREQLVRVLHRLLILLDLLQRAHRRELRGLREELRAVGRRERVLVLHLRDEQLQERVLVELVGVGRHRRLIWENARCGTVDRRSSIAPDGRHTRTSSNDVASGSRVGAGWQRRGPAGTRRSSPSPAEAVRVTRVLGRSWLDEIRRIRRTR